MTALPPYRVTDKGFRTAVAAALTVGIGLGVWLAPDRGSTAVPAVSEPHEDEPGWDCRLHGNRRCQP